MLNAPSSPFAPELGEVLHGAHLTPGQVLQDVPLTSHQVMHGAHLTPGQVLQGVPLAPDLVMLGEILHSASVCSLGHHEWHLKQEKILLAAQPQLVLNFNFQTAITLETCRGEDEIGHTFS
jgi:hypothetical protein